MEIAFLRVDNAGSAQSLLVAPERHENSNESGNTGSRIRSRILASCPSVQPPAKPRMKRALYSVLRKLQAAYFRKDRKSGEDTNAADLEDCLTVYIYRVPEAGKGRTGFARKTMPIGLPGISGIIRTKENRQNRPKSGNDCPVGLDSLVKTVS